MKIFKFGAIFIIFLVVISVAIWNFSTRSSAQDPEPECSPVINKDVASIPVGVDIFPGDTVEITIAIPGCTEELRNPADTMLVMDRSGSMAISWLGKIKIDSARDALKAFVDQTQEDGVTSGDYVGLATYSTDATLDFGIANMTAANRTTIKTAIDSFSAAGWTSIGNGMDVANQELINNGRPPEVSKYMVLATDGRQNRAASPYENNILQTAIDNNITIFTVGIGFDVTVLSSFWSGCVGCPDPSGDSLFSGEEILKDVACKTDQNRLDPADNCILVWDPTNDPAINDWDRPAHYFFANDPAKLTQIYENIANEITANTWFQILDAINTTVFKNIVPGSVHAVDCATGNPWPGATVLFEGGTFFIIRLENVGENDTVCIQLQAVIRSDAEAGEGFKVDQTGLAVVWDPDNLCDPAVDGLSTCIIQMLPLPRIDIPFGSIDIAGADPWLKTTGGDVGSFFDIDMLRDVNLDGFFNADYLVIAQNPFVIDNFYSGKGWEIDQYGGLTGLILDPDPTSSTMYDVLWDKYRGKIEDTTGTVVPPPDELNNGIITGAVDVDGGVMLWDGDIGGVNVTNFGAGANERPAVIFVDGNMTIDNNISINANSGIIFIVSGDITVDATVDEIAGMFITDGTFYSRDVITCALNPSHDDDRLVINGAVYAFGDLCFTRDLGASNENTPAELINYEPKYLYLFQEIVGDPTVIYREVAP